MAGRRTTPRRRRERAPSKARRRNRRRLLASGFAVALVVAGLLTLHLYVKVTSRFEGRLWAIPTRVYSDRLVLRSGSLVDPDRVVERLERCGYARTPTTPERPGQYRRRGSVLEIFPRPFEGAEPELPDRAVQVRFGRGWVASLRADGGGRIRRVELEPELLGTLWGARREERRLIDLDEVPEALIHAVLAAEDARFYEHGGVDLRAVGRASLTNLRQGRIAQGGSTITQQTVKNLFLGHQRTWWRKARELPMALLLDLRYRKDRILHVYLNEVYLGQRGSVAVCGIEAASRFYFGRSVGALSLGESALLAGMIRSPGRYNPFVHPERARERREIVLEAMQRLGFIDEDARRRAAEEDLRLGSGGGGFDRAPHVLDYVRSRLAELLPSRELERDGLSVTTTVDTALQAGAEDTLRQGLERLEQERPAVRRQLERRRLQGVLVALEPDSGAVLAMVGGRDYSSSQFNRAVQARRQPGSCFKPFVYAAAFERNALGGADGLTPASLLEDSPIRRVSGGRPWSPENYDGRFRGPVTARRALEESLNVPTVRAAERVGLASVVDLAGRAGIESPLTPLPSLALGTLEVTPLELASAYATLAAQGRRTPPRVLREVRDRDGELLWESGAVATQALDSRAAFLTTHVLEGVFERGTAKTARALGFSGRAAGKTGTTDETRDAWFVGYTPDVLALVWVGYDDNARTGLTGAGGALPIWVRFMQRGGLAESRRRFAAPRGLVPRTVDPLSGGLAVAGCPERVHELFARGTEPRESCELHRRGFKRWFRRLIERDRRRAT